MHDVRAVRAPSMLRLAAASLVGTAIEIYDSIVYGTAAALILGPLFFPTFSPLTGTLLAFASAGIAFLARPLGSVVFGHIGDRRGRRPVLVASLWLTGAATVAVGCLPTYATMGATAPVLLLVLRFVQGLGLGGEWSGAVLLTVEHAPARRRVLWSSFPQMGLALGFLLANVVMLGLSATLSDAQFAAWGWRVPFWAAGVLTAVGLWLRGSLAESPHFLEIDHHARVPLLDVLRGHWRLVLLTAGSLAVGFAVAYTVTTWTLAYGTVRLGVSRTVILACVMAVVVVQGALTPLVAHLADRCARRSLCLAGCTAVALWMFPMVALLSTGRPLLMFLGSLGAMLSLTPMFAVTAAYVPELYDARVRCTGAALGYNLGGVVGGTLTPIITTTLAERSSSTPWSIGVYLTAMALLSFGCFALLPETRPPAAPSAGLPPAQAPLHSRRAAPS
ncbi:MFS transporter [Streptomyces sp. NPDC046931]|uniref:MFS transporter n=1 Tax=Streptomyces sp. NPDC046931 TaxID=3154806 RepID=UPI0033E67972